MEGISEGGETVIQTINTEGPQEETPGGDSGTSSIPDKSNSSRELVSTIADPEPEEANNTEADEDDDKGGEPEGETDVKPEGETEVDPDGEDEKLDRFDKHPRFQELRQKAEEDRERAIKAEAKLEALQSVKKEDAKPDYEDVMEMDDETLDEKWTDDKRGFLQNFGKQIASEIFAGLDERSQEQSRTQGVNMTYDKYAESNPDFQMMLDSGEIRTFIQKNPGHNAISAHMNLSGEAKEAAREVATQGKIDEAVKAANKKSAENHSVKRKAAVISEDGTTSTTTAKGIAPELKHPNKFGGVTNVLLSRLQAMRKGKEG